MKMHIWLPLMLLLVANMFPERTEAQTSSN
jgi:hypothetical protein